MTTESHGITIGEVSAGFVCKSGIISLYDVAPQPINVLAGKVRSVCFIAYLSKWQLKIVLHLRPDPQLL